LPKAQAQTLKETEKWIEEKIELYGLIDIDISHTYNMEFSGDYLIITEETILLGRPMYSKITVPIKEMHLVIFEENKNSTWLIIKIKDGNSLIKYEVYGEQTEYTSSYSLILEKSFSESGLKPRMLKAFQHLFTLKGVDISKETF
jgi:hypothetical protein